MVSQDFSEASVSSTACQCSSSETDCPPGHSEDFSYAMQWNGRNHNDFIHVNNVLPSIQSLGGQICQSVDLIQPRGSEDPGISYGQGHGLSLRLSPCLLSNVSLYNYKQKTIPENIVRSNYAREDPLRFECQGAKDANNDHMFYERRTAGSYSTLKSSGHISHDMAPSITTIQNSRYLKPTQQLLDEAVCVSNLVELVSDKQLKKIRPVGTTFMSGSNSLQVLRKMNECLSEEKQAVQSRIEKLVELLDKLESRYEQYFHQMNNVISSFEVVAGKGAAASYTALTIQAMYKHFSNLRDAIATQIQVSRESLAEGLPRNHSIFDQNNGQKRETLPNLGMIQYRQAWRPLRGLPETSVAVLRAWLFEHFLHPYPSDNEKLMLASRTGLTKNQISNWFINARVRLWKPMIEEMYKEEFADDSRDSTSST